MNTQEALQLATGHLQQLSGHTFGVIDIAKPVSIDAAVNLSKVVSKLSPIIGNLIEFNTVEYLNGIGEFQTLGKWERQDPGFPDAVFRGSIDPTPGFEIKAWFPLATEITARFKDSQNHFQHDQTHVVMLAWLPASLLFGCPYIVDVCVVSGLSVAQARDNHYHNPPDYLVLEPEDTAARTRNLQQTNTNGYKWQGTDQQFEQAKVIVASWKLESKEYLPTRKYQANLRELIAQFPYRLDTNFAKMDRIAHDGIESFKNRVLESTVHGRTVADWNRLLFRGTTESISEELQARFGIGGPDGHSVEGEIVQ